MEFVQYLGYDEVTNICSFSSEPEWLLTAIDCGDIEFDDSTEQLMIQDKVVYPYSYIHVEDGKVFTLEENYIL